MYVICIFWRFQDKIPMRVKAVHVVNQPFYFSALYAVFRPFLKKKLRKRVSPIAIKYTLQLYLDNFVITISNSYKTNQGMYDNFINMEFYHWNDWIWIKVKLFLDHFNNINNEETLETFYPFAFCLYT